jgi:competence protein ComEA
LVELADGARVADAVAAAGGSLPGAEVESVNLAATLGDGEQVIIPGPSSGPQPSIGDSDGVVSLNRATVDELEQLPGVGPVIAQRIIEFRESHGPFDAIEDLLDVPGIGEAKLASLREHVVP